MMPGAMPQAMRSSSADAKHERTDARTDLRTFIFPPVDISPVRYAHDVKEIQR